MADLKKHSKRQNNTMFGTNKLNRNSVHKASMPENRVTDLKGRIVMITVSQS